MTWRHYLLLFVIGFLVPYGISRFQTMPGYMDADYYFVGGVQLANGKGFSEPYIWNYLDNPSGLPHPSHTYWIHLRGRTPRIHSSFCIDSVINRCACL
jgi:hypothetical protein